MAELEARKRLARGMGGEAGIARQRARGKLTVRERIDALLDPGSFQERGMLAGRGAYGDDNQLTGFTPANYVTGIGAIDGRRVVVGGGDFTVRGGAADGSVGNKREFAERMARELRLPFVRLLDQTGGSVRSVEQIGRTYLPGNPHWAESFAMLGEVPVVALALGSVAGLPAAEVAGAHFSVMVAGISHVFAAGPPVVKRALGIDISAEELGGAGVHARDSGVVDNEAASEQEAFDQARRFLSYLPTNAWRLPPVVAADDPPDRRDDALRAIIPANPRRPYDVRDLLARLFDTGSVFEMSRGFGGAHVTALARLAGHPVGVLANDPLVGGGAMDATAAQKLMRFVDMCDTFNLPIVHCVDEPGFMIGEAAERAGTLRHGVRALAAVHQSVVPWATVIVRRVFGVAGGGHQPHARWTFRVAWPTAEWGSLPIAGGVMAAYRREIEAADDPDARRAEIEARLQGYASPFRSAEAFNIEDIVDPAETRPLLCDWVAMAYDALPELAGPKFRGTRP